MHIPQRILLYLVFAGLFPIFLLSLNGCAGAESGKREAAFADHAPLTPTALPSAQGGTSDTVAVCWLPLIQRLQTEKMDGIQVASYFAGLPEYSANPMAVKIKELFRNAFLRTKVPPDPTKPPPPSIYPGIVTSANVERSKEFLATYAQAFAGMEKKHGVPKEIIVSLLFLETRLGANLGKENAFWSLACMAAADTPPQVTEGVRELPLTSEHDGWLQAKLTDKSNWAYKELKALLVFCNAQKIDPRSVPGSVYGAIGICQFMPSNLTAYADDGDGDGVINPFSEPDAIYSAARYLKAHGWKEDISVAEQRSVIKRYNNITRYANTILAMAESIKTGVLQTGPPDAPKGATKGTSKGKKSTSGQKAAKAAPKVAKGASKAKPRVVAP